MTQRCALCGYTSPTSTCAVCASGTPVTTLTEGVRTLAGRGTKGLVPHATSPHPRAGRATVWSSQAHIVAAYRWFAAQYGRLPTTGDLKAPHPGLPSIHSVIRHCGSHRQACLLAEREPAPGDATHA